MCCVFQPAFRFLQHLKAGWNTFFSHFQPFLFLKLPFVLWYLKTRPSLNPSLCLCPAILSIHCLNHAGFPLLFPSPIYQSNFLSWRRSRKKPTFILLRDLQCLQKIFQRSLTENIFAYKFADFANKFANFANKLEKGKKSIFCKCLLTIVSPNEL